MSQLPHPQEPNTPPSQPGGLLVGNSHSQGGIKIKTPEGQIEAEGGETILNKRSMASGDVLEVKGTPKEIASAINEYKGGVTFEPGAELHIVEKNDLAQRGLDIKNNSMNTNGIKFERDENYVSRTKQPGYNFQYEDNAGRKANGIIKFNNTINEFEVDIDESYGTFPNDPADPAYRSVRDLVINEFNPALDEHYNATKFAWGGIFSSTKKEESAEKQKEIQKKIKEFSYNVGNVREDYRHGEISGAEYADYKQKLINEYSPYISQAHHYGINVNPADLMITTGIKSSGYFRTTGGQAAEGLAVAQARDVVSSERAKMKFEAREMDKLFKITSMTDRDLPVWYGKVVEIEKYIIENKSLIPKYNPKDDWETSLFKFGLTANEVSPALERDLMAAKGTIIRSSDPNVRPSPSVSATIYPEGYKMEGNDGNLWEIHLSGTGIHRWVKIREEDGGELAADGMWIKDAIQHPGILRNKAKHMGLIHGDQKLSEADLQKIERLGGKWDDRVRLARKLKSFKHKAADGIEIAECGCEVKAEHGTEVSEPGATTGEGSIHKEKSTHKKEGYDTIKVGLGVFGENEFYRLTAPSVSGIGIYPKKLYTEAQAKKAFYESHIAKKASTRKFHKVKINKDTMTILFINYGDMRDARDILRNAGMAEEFFQKTGTHLTNLKFINWSEFKKAIGILGIEETKAEDGTEIYAQGGGITIQNEHWTDEELGQVKFDMEKYFGMPFKDIDRKMLWNMGVTRLGSTRDNDKMYNAILNATAQDRGLLKAKDGKDIHRFVSAKVFDNETYYTIGEPDDEKALYNTQEIALLNDGFEIELELRAIRNSKELLQGYLKEIQENYPTAQLVFSNNEYGGNWRIYIKPNKAEAGTAIAPQIDTKTITFEEFNSKLPDIKSPYVGEESVVYKPKYNSYASRMSYFKHGRKNLHSMSVASAYVHYLYDQYGIRFRELSLEERKQLFGKYANQYKLENFEDGGEIDEEYEEIRRAIYNEIHALATKHNGVSVQSQQNPDGFNSEFSFPTPEDKEAFAADMRSWKKKRKFKYDNGGELPEYIQELKDFDLNNLDAFERIQYANFINHIPKEQVLQLLINSVEGDYSQLSPELAAIAEKYYPEEQFAKGGEIKITNIDQIPNIYKKVDEGSVTYRGLGMGKLADKFYKIAGENGTRITVDGEEYYITDTDFRKLNWDFENNQWLNKIRFSAPHRKFAGGGPVNPKDSVTMDIPLLIRTLELAREDIKSDAELHKMVERLIELKDKGTLTMDDYDFIENVKATVAANGGPIPGEDIFSVSINYQSTSGKPITVTDFVSAKDENDAIAKLEKKVKARKNFMKLDGGSAVKYQAKDGADLSAKGKAIEEPFDVVISEEDIKPGLIVYTGDIIAGGKTLDNRAKVISVKGDNVTLETLSTTIFEGETTEAGTEFTSDKESLMLNWIKWDGNEDELAAKGKAIKNYSVLYFDVVDGNYSPNQDVKPILKKYSKTFFILGTKIWVLVDSQSEIALKKELNKWKGAFDDWDNIDLNELEITSKANKEDLENAIYSYGYAAKGKAIDDASKITARQVYKAVQRSVEDQKLTDGVVSNDQILLDVAQAMAPKETSINKAEGRILVRIDGQSAVDLNGFAITVLTGKNTSKHYSLAELVTGTDVDHKWKYDGYRTLKFKFSGGGTIGKNAETHAQALENLSDTLDAISNELTDNDEIMDFAELRFTLTDKTNGKFKKAVKFINEFEEEKLPSFQSDEIIKKIKLAFDVFRAAGKAIKKKAQDEVPSVETIEAFYASAETNGQHTTIEDFVSRGVLTADQADSLLAGYATGVSPQNKHAMLMKIYGKKAENGILFSQGGGIKIKGEFWSDDMLGQVKYDMEKHFGQPFQDIDRKMLWNMGVVRLGSTRDNDKMYNALLNATAKDSGAFNTAATGTVVKKPFQVRVNVKGSDTETGYDTYQEAKTAFDEEVLNQGYEVESSKSDYAIDPDNEDNWIELYRVNK